MDKRLMIMLLFFFLMDLILIIILFRQRNAGKVIDFFRRVVKNCHVTEIVTRAFLNTCVMLEDREKMKDFTNWHTLAKRLSENDVTVEEFHGMLSPWEWCRASWIVAARDEHGVARIVLFTVEDITFQMHTNIQKRGEVSLLQ